jgi:hypothetical protein
MVCLLFRQGAYLISPSISEAEQSEGHHHAKRKYLRMSKIESETSWEIAGIENAEFEFGLIMVPDQDYP